MGNVDWDMNSKRFNMESKVGNMIDKRRQISKQSNENIEEWENALFVHLKPLEDHGETTTEETSGTVKRGRPTKRLSEGPGDKTLHRILDGILDSLTSVATEQRISTSKLLRQLTDRWVERNEEDSPKEVTPDMPVLSA